MRITTRSDELFKEATVSIIVRAVSSWAESDEPLFMLGEHLAKQYKGWRFEHRKNKARLKLIGPILMGLEEDLMYEAICRRGLAFPRPE